eukprot:COSAG05_NODE_1083_length_5933_cov_3.284196_2_plen_122_part_00
MDEERVFEDEVVRLESTKVLASTKDKVLNLYMQATDELECKDFNGALATLTEAQALAEVLSSEHESASELGDVCELKATVERKIKSRELQARGQSLFAEEKYEEAAAVLQQAMELDPENQV